MNIFLIRHGETVLNKSNTHQMASTPLSEIGLQQAKNLAKRLKEAKIDRIYSSPMLRAKQTAETIASASGLDLTFMEELREVKRPSAIEGMSHDDPVAKQIKRAMFEQYANKDWHHSDEENFWDVKTRVERLQQRIETETVEDILLVSHGVTIKMFLTLCIFGKTTTPDKFLAIYDRTHISNTGVTHFEFTKKSGWKVLRVNDTTHLTASGE